MLKAVLDKLIGSPEARALKKLTRRLARTQERAAELDADPVRGLREADDAQNRDDAEALCFAAATAALRSARGDAPVDPSIASAELIASFRMAPDTVVEAPAVVALPEALVPFAVARAHLGNPVVVAWPGGERAAMERARIFDALELLGLTTSHRPSDASATCIPFVSLGDVARSVFDADQSDAFDLLVPDADLSLLELPARNLARDTDQVWIARHVVERFRGRVFALSPVEAGAEWWASYQLDTRTLAVPPPWKIREDRIYKTSEERLEQLVAMIALLREQGAPVLVGVADGDGAAHVARGLEAHGIATRVPRDTFGSELEAMLTGATGDVVVPVVPITQLRGVWLRGDRPVAIGVGRQTLRRQDDLLGRVSRSVQHWLALDDELLEVFGSERIARLVERLRLPYGEAIEHKLVHRAIARAQAKLADRHLAALRRTVGEDAQAPIDLRAWLPESTLDDVFRLNATHAGDEIALEAGTAELTLHLAIGTRTIRFDAPFSAMLSHSRGRDGVAVHLDLRQLLGGRWHRLGLTALAHPETAAQVRALPALECRYSTLPWSGFLRVLARVRGALQTAGTERWL